MSAYHIQRSIVIEKSTQEVFDYIKNFHTWGQWSPWLCTEKTAEVNISGNGSNEGDVYAWKGKLVGEGTITNDILEFPSRIDQTIRFVKPFTSEGHVYWDFEGVENGTKVTWHMESSLPFFLFFMKKKMIAWMEGDYDRGLKMIKEAMETGEVLTNIEIGDVIDFPEVEYVGLKTRCTIAEIGPKMQEDFAKMEQIFVEKAVTPVGAPFSIYNDFNMVKGTCTYTLGFPAEEMPNDIGEFLIGTIPAHRALKATHTGSYDNLGNAWMAGFSYIQNTKGLKVNKKIPPFEIYVDNPEEVPPKDLKTELYFPVK